MSRLKVLAALFVVCILIRLVFWGGFASYWSELTADDGPAGHRATARLASTRAATTRGRPAADTGSTLLRELPRQALLIAAAHDLNLPAGDRSVDFHGVTAPPPLTCRQTYDFARETAHVSVQDAKGVEVRTLDLPVPMVVANHPDYAKVAATVERWGEAHFVPLLAKASGSAPAPAAATTATTTRKPANAAAPLPPEIEPLLAQVDPQRAFLAANLLHRAIAESGESPQRLAALVRAYSHLGESTRYLYSRHGSAFFARALIYAERLARKHPDLPLTHAARGYAYTLLGQPLEGRRAFARARELAGAGAGAGARDAALPAWAQLAEHLNHFRTRALFDRIAGDDAPLASYLMLLTVEHSGLQSVVITMSRQALELNPGALRVINIMTDNSGVSLQHETTARSTTAQLELLSKLATDPAAPAAVPEPLRVAAATAAQQQFAPPALLELLAKMDAEPAADGQLLPWGAYASVARDALFASGFRRLYFTQQMLATDAGNRLQSWWPILKDHRFAAVLAGFDRTGAAIGGDNKDAAAALNRIGRNDFSARMTWMIAFMKRRHAAATATAPAGGGAGGAWIENYEYTADDGTAYDLAHLLWTYGGKEADGIGLLGAMKGEVAKSLAVMCPDHPSAVAELIVNRWPETRDRAAQIEREMGGHPQVAYALARAYRAEQRVADAARLLEQVIAVSPDRAAYEELAGLYKQQGDDEKWLAVHEKYLAGSEDFGLDHARKNEEIAYTLMRMKKPEKALKYAAAAAESYASWGLEVYAICLTELNRHAEAEQVEQANQRRYPQTFAWYRWCRTTGAGDLAAARELSAAHVAAEADATPPQALNDLAIYFYLEGQLDRARAYWEQSFRHDPDPYEAMQLALLDLADGKPEEAEARLDRARFEQPGAPAELAQMMGNVTPRRDEQRAKVYRATADELYRCLSDPNAVPRRDDPALKVVLDATGTPYRVNASFVLGRLCELRGKPDEAAWWYRAALDSGEWTASSGPMAAAALRGLRTEPPGK